MKKAPSPEFPARALFVEVRKCAWWVGNLDGSLPMGRGSAYAGAEADFSRLGKEVFVPPGAGR